jgi:hypothetical protein
VRTKVLFTLREFETINDAEAFLNNLVGTDEEFFLRKKRIRFESQWFQVRRVLSYQMTTKLCNNQVYYILLIECEVPLPDDIEQ